MNESPEASQQGSSRASGRPEYWKPLPERAIEYWAIDVNSNGTVSRSHGLEKTTGTMPRTRTMKPIEPDDIRVVFVRMRPSQDRPEGGWALSPYLFTLWERRRSGERVTFDVPVVLSLSSEETKEWNTNTAVTEELLDIPRASMFWETIQMRYYEMPTSLGFNWNDDGLLEGIVCLSRSLVRSS